MPTILVAIRFRVTYGLNMRHGVINVPVADLRLQPEMHSERLSQALFGTAVEIKQIKNNYARVVLPEGYIGWCRLPHINQIGFDKWRKYRARKKRRTRLMSASVYDQTGKKQHPFNLFFGTELAVKIKNNTCAIDLPGGVNGYLPASSLQPPMAKKQIPVKSSQILRCARRFLGSPYLWGGITPAGIDCSGLVQTVFRFYGIELPRDSKDQHHCGEKIDKDNIRAGDLLFFPGHVGFSLGGDNIIHASAFRGMVAIDSLDKSDDNFRPDLQNDFEFARRICL